MNSSTLPSPTTNWRRFAEYGPDGKLVNPHTELWDAPAFAGFYWWRLCLVRVEMGVELTLPEMGKLIGVMKKQMEPITRGHLFRRITTLLTYFDYVQYRLGSLGRNQVLNETTLQNAPVAGLVDQLVNLQRTDEGRAQIVAEVAAFEAKREAEAEALATAA